ncbi:MAG TPA: MerR family transcriptional regulator [Ilumatobacter sp.]|nr:MerR family transcriptional regulator [Ilumatobacter sp.]
MIDRRETVEPRMHQIGEVADVVGLSLRTIRYYEEAELVLPSGRSSGGFRLYTELDIERLRLVKHMKSLDFSIEEMRDLMHVRDRLADPATQSLDREALGARLSMFAMLADERCEMLRQQLAAAYRVSATLRHEARATVPSDREPR